MPSNKKTINLSNDDLSSELSIKDASVGPSVVDLANLNKDTGLFTFDPSYSSTASCESKVTYIDGDEGILEYRGYPIEQLANKSTYLEVSYLLFNGELPKKEELSEFRHNVKHNMVLDSNLNQLFTGFLPNAHPMGMLMSSVAALSTIYHEDIDIKRSVFPYILNYQSFLDTKTAAYLDIDDDCIQISDIIDTKKNPDYESLR